MLSVRKCVLAVHVCARVYHIDAKIHVFITLNEFVSESSMCLSLAQSCSRFASFKSFSKVC